MPLKRYIIHLLPEPTQRARLDALRARLAERIGRKKALDYPTVHITLVQNIQDDANDADPIDEARFGRLLDQHVRQHALELSLEPPAMRSKDLIMRVEDTLQLAELRRAALAAAQAAARSSDSSHAGTVKKLNEQSWPHLTLAQDLGESQARLGMAFLAENRHLIPTKVLANEVALLSRELPPRQPYRISHLVTLA